MIALPTFKVLFNLQVAFTGSFGIFITFRCLKKLSNAFIIPQHLVCTDLYYNYENLHNPKQKNKVFISLFSK